MLMTEDLLGPSSTSDHAKCFHGLGQAGPDLLQWMYVKHVSPTASSWMQTSLHYASVLFASTSELWQHDHVPAFLILSTI